VHFDSGFINKAADLKKKKYGVIGDGLWEIDRSNEEEESVFSTLGRNLLEEQRSYVDNVSVL